MQVPCFANKCCLLIFLQELLLTGSLFWSPLLCSLLFILLSPSGAGMQRSKEEAIRQAVEEVKREAAARVPVSLNIDTDFRLVHMLMSKSVHGLAIKPQLPCDLPCVICMSSCLPRSLHLRAQSS